MSSSVFYKFKNSKEPERIVFDGTDISVFELKREIINSAGLGKTDDYVLLISLDGEELKDDTFLVPRSSTVQASRRPCPKGKGNAARYLTGRAPTRSFAKKADPIIGTTAGAATESDAEAAFFANEAQNWEQAKESLAKGEKVAFRSKKPVNVPDHPPPPGYVCYRCNEKGHWIQQCPTNSDPNFQQKPRAKRTTGIPKSMLQRVDKSEVDEEDTTVFLDADGHFVRVLKDEKSWNAFQAKATASKTQAANADAANKEMEERGLLCPLDKKLMVDPVATPCCSKSACRSCIEDALAEGDLICPFCSTPDILLDDLATDEDMIAKIRFFEAEKAKEKAEKEQQAKEESKADEKPSSSANNENEVLPQGDSVRAGSKSPKPSEAASNQNQNQNQNRNQKVNSPLTVAANPTTTSTSSSAAVVAAAAATPNGNVSDSDTSTTSKKRKDAPTEIKAPTAPKAMRIQKEQQSRQQQTPSNNLEQDFLQQMEALKNMPANAMPNGMPNGMANAMPNGMPMMPNMSMSSGNMAMNPMMGMMNPMGMNGFPTNNPMNGMNGTSSGGNWTNGFQQQAFQNGNMYGFNNGYQNMQNGGNWGGGYNNGYQQQQQQMGMGMNGMNGMGGLNGMGAMGGMNGMNGMNGMSGMSGMAGFNAQASNTSQQDAYDRKPVNPHRNQKRKQRAPDYRYV